MSTFKRGDRVRMYDGTVVTYWYRACSGKDVVIFPATDRVGPWMEFVSPGLIKISAQGANRDSMPSWAR